jgi:hypothetical protein
LEVSDRHQRQARRRRQIRSPRAAGDADEIKKAAAQLRANVVDQRLESAAGSHQSSETFARNRRLGGEDHRRDAAHPFAPAQLRGHIGEFDIEIEARFGAAAHGWLSHRYSPQSRKVGRPVNSRAAPSMTGLSSRRRMARSDMPPMRTEARMASSDRSAATTADAALARSLGCAVWSLIARRPVTCPPVFHPSIGRVRDDLSLRLVLWQEAVARSLGAAPRPASPIEARCCAGADWQIAVKTQGFSALDSDARFACVLKMLTPRQNPKAPHLINDATGVFRLFERIKDRIRLTIDEKATRCLRPI